VDAQEQQLVAALTPGGTVAPGEPEQAVMVDGARGTRTPMPVPPGDYPEFYRRLRDAIDGAGGNPVPPEQAVAVAAVVETAIRSSAEGRALAVPLTESERLAFGR
jgi:predicted dehydrogenase